MENVTDNEQPKIKLVRHQGRSHVELPDGDIKTIATEQNKFSPPEIKTNTVDDIWRMNLNFLRGYAGNGICGDKLAAILDLNRKHFSWLVLAKFESIHLLETRAGSSTYDAMELNDCRKYYIFSEMEIKYSKNIDFNGIIFAPAVSREDAAALTAKTMKEAFFLGAKVDFKTEMMTDGLTSTTGYNRNYGYSAGSSSAKRSNLKRVITEKWDYCPSIGGCGYVAFRKNNDSISREFPLY